MKFRQSILRTISTRTILTVIPLNIKFHNFRLNRLYKRKVRIKNTSNTIARYQLIRRNANSEFVVMLNDSTDQERKNLAPGMEGTLTIFFRPQHLEQHIEQMTINVKHGKSIVIRVHAYRDIPILEGINISNEKRDAQIPLSLVDSESSFQSFNNLKYCLKPQDITVRNIHNKEKRQNLVQSDAIRVELDCAMCFVGEQVTVEMMIKNLGGDGRFLLMTEKDWHTMDIRSVSQNNQIMMSCFTVWPAYFSLKTNEFMILRTLFRPSCSGLHIEQLKIVCDNFADQSIEVLGDGVIFDKGLIQFGKNVERIPSREHEVVDGVNWAVELTRDVEDPVLQADINLTNLCELGLFYRWERRKSDSYYSEDEYRNSQSQNHLSIQPMCGFISAHSETTFRITSISDSMIEHHSYVQLQFIVEDIPRSALPEDFDLSVYPNIHKQRQCSDSVDICLGNIEIRDEVCDEGFEQLADNYMR